MTKLQDSGTCFSYFHIVGASCMHADIWSPNIVGGGGGGSPGQGNEKVSYI